MKPSYSRIALACVILFTLTSCEAVAGIFKAGMGFGIFIVLAVVILIVALVLRSGKGK